MKLDLPTRSKEHEEHIRKIAETIVACGGKQILFVILFGSFARGDWIFDRYSEDGIIYQYASDYDFLIINKSKKVEGEISDFDLERKVSRSVGILGGHKPHFVTESIDYVNSELEKGRYFFSDIKKEGILLYDSGEAQLSEPRILSKKEILELARQDYEHWFHKGTRFLVNVLFNMQDNDLTTAAFLLHQSAESFYNCALLVQTGYKPKTHDLEELNKLCAAQNHDFLMVFPLATADQKECFKQLQKAYVEARYNKHYKINKEQLEYLIARVEKLKKIVEDVWAKRSLTLL